MFYTKYPENNALTSLYVAVALLDIYYLGLLYRVRPPSVQDAAPA
jgi:hypothetical protein